MALLGIYEQFLASPSQASLSETASFSYVPTLTTFKNAEPIIKQLQQQNKSIVKTQAQKIISAIEGQNALAMDVETTLEFISGGGTYLPGLDNFVVDKIATFPATHIVAFDSDRKIKQIRISWDQGALLKQTGIIGSSGRNWPIYDGKDQARLIAGASVGMIHDSASSERGRATEQAAVTGRRTSPNKKHIADPHSTLIKTGFAPPDDEDVRVTSPSPVAPRMSCKPPPRDLGELFVGEDSKATESARQVSPPKGATHHRHQASRLFDDSNTEEPQALRYKSDPNKYAHFELGHGENLELEPPKPAATNRPMSMRPMSNKNETQWNFEDFATPLKPGNKVRGHDVRHFGWSDDEGELAGSPGKHPHVPRPRPDAETHFEIQDQTPVAEKTRPTSRSSRNAAVFNNANGADENSRADTETKRPLSTVTNINSRRNDFDAHWAVGDESPTSKPANNENKPHAASQMKHVKMMDAHWSYDQSPEQTKPENKRPMPARKNVLTDRHWSFGDDDEGVADVKPKKTSAGGGAKNFWDF